MRSPIASTASARGCAGLPVWIVPPWRSKAPGASAVAAATTQSQATAPAARHWNRIVMSVARFLALHDVGRERDHRGDIGEVRRHDQRARRLVRERPELLDVLLRDPQLHRLGAATPGQSLADWPQALCGRRRHREDRRRLALGLVDLLLLVGLGFLDDALLLALGLVDLGVALALGRSEERRVGKECRSRWTSYREKNKVKIE